MHRFNNINIVDIASYIISVKEVDQYKHDYNNLL
jgi:hypothetical protein